MRAQAQPPRRKWPWIVIGVILAGLIVYTLYALATRTAGPDEPTPTPTEMTPIGAEPTGCLVGNGLDAQTLLDTQREAPHTTAGAVEVATALMRWAYRYPYPSPEDADSVSAAIISSNAPESFRDLRAFFASNPNVSGGIVADETEYRVSTVTGVWFLDDEQEDVATVSVGAAFVVEGQLSSSLRASTTVTLRWEDGAWRADQLIGTRTTEELFGIGTSFTGGC